MQIVQEDFPHPGPPKSDCPPYTQKTREPLRLVQLRSTLDPLDSLTSHVQCLTFRLSWFLPSPKSSVSFSENTFYE